MNVALNQAGWFACVLGAAAGRETLGVALSMVLVALHLGLAEQRDREVRLVLMAGGLGLVVDSLHGGLGVLDFRDHSAGELAPVWIVALWMQFGTSLRFSLSWLSRRYSLAALFGAVGGPLAFLGGERLGAAAFGEPRALSLAVLALSWGIALPLLVALADRFGGQGRYWLPGVPTAVASRDDLTDGGRLQPVALRARAEGTCRTPSRR